MSSRASRVTPLSFSMRRILPTVLLIIWSRRVFTALIWSRRVFTALVITASPCSVPLPSAPDMLRLARERLGIRVALLSQHDIPHPLTRRQGNAEQPFSQ